MPPVPDYADQRPVYAQIADDLRERVKAGEHQPGDRLPANRILSRRYESSMATIRQAIDVLRGEGLVETQSTRGTFVLRAGGEPSQFDVAMARMDALAEEVRQLQERFALVEQIVLPGEPSGIPEPEPVVAAIVVSPEGVLVGRRNDGQPPWTFIAGKIEPGESPADAAVREVKEETGLEVTAGGVIGRRVHPATGRTMVYMAATPVHGTDVFLGDTEELAELRWVSLPEANELMGGMIYEPVQDHLWRVLPSALR